MAKKEEWKSENIADDCQWAADFVNGLSSQRKHILLMTMLPAPLQALYTNAVVKKLGGGKNV